MSNLFQTLEYEAFRNGITPRTKESRKWFQKKASQLSVGRRNIMASKSLTKESNAIAGTMVFFGYDAKHKATLPYYDKFPLTIVMGPAKGGFYGLNLHYLPMQLRAKFLDSLLDNLTNKRYNENTRFKLNYQMLKASQKNRYFKPCWKHYLTAHVKSHFAKVDSPEWEIATFLPVAQFTSSSNKVWKDSRGMI